MTQSLLLEPPESTEYVPYFAKYISLVPQGDVLESMERQLEETLSLLGSISPSKAEFRYAVGKWTIKEVVGHISDTERVMCHRALRFSRGDVTPLPAFDENEYVRQANFGDRTLADLASEFGAVRIATLRFFRSLGDEALMCRGVANNNGFTVRALAYIIAGHERHHVKLIRERYL
jgi:hypothetical protein